MGDVPEPVLIETTKLEKQLREIRCVKGGCNNFVCYWVTPVKKQGFTAPNPETVPMVPITAFTDLYALIGRLDSDKYIPPTIPNMDVI